MSDAMRWDVVEPEGGCRGVVLVMDDEVIVRKISTEMLERLGFEVVCCSNGAEAVAFYAKLQEEGTPLTVTILDIEIPDGMGGVEAAARILTLDPAARIIVSSGNHWHDAMVDFAGHGFCGVLPKPYRMSELEEVISFSAPPRAVS